MSLSPIDPFLPVDPPIDLRAHPRTLGSDVFHRFCPAVFVATTNQTERAKPAKRTTPAPTGKICPLCETWKRTSEFYPDPLQSNGIRTYCKQCNSRICGAVNHGGNVASVRERLAAKRAAERERGTA